MVTRKDVAKRAGVSPTAVSYAINNSGYVSKENREKIMQAVEELGYRPNNIARSLKTKKTNLFVIIVNDIRNEFFANVAYSMEQYASLHGYTLLVYNTRDDLRSLPNLIDYQIDGVFVYSKKMQVEQINLFAKNAIPTVVASNIQQFGYDPAIRHIYINTFDGVKQAVRHLIRMGHRHIAYFNALSSGSNDIRLAAYRAALADHDVAYNEKLVCDLSAHLDIQDAVLRTLEQDGDITAFIGSNDNIAIGILSAVTGIGKRVPHDFSIVGIGDIGLSQLVYPSLTAVNIPAAEIGEKAAELLVRMNLEKAVADLNMDTTLCIRDSTGKARSPER